MSTMKNAIIEILNSGTGSGVDNCGILFTYPLEDGRFSVSWGEDWKSHEEIFLTAEEAADRFLELRSEKKLGFDFEK